jgi:hypothetical protein
MNLLAGIRGQERESSDSPILKAFCRVAPSVLFNFLAMLAAGVFLRAIDFRSRSSAAVHARRFFGLLAIKPPFKLKAACIPYGRCRQSQQMAGQYIWSSRTILTNAAQICLSALTKSFVSSFISALREQKQTQLTRTTGDTNNK